MEQNLLQLSANQDKFFAQKLLLPRISWEAILVVSPWPIEAKEGHFSLDHKWRVWTILSLPQVPLDQSVADNSWSLGESHD